MDWVVHLHPFKWARQLADVAGELQLDRAEQIDLGGGREQPLPAGSKCVAVSTAKRMPSSLAAACLAREMAMKAAALRNSSDSAPR